MAPCGVDVGSSNDPRKHHNQVAREAVEQRLDAHKGGGWDYFTASARYSRYVECGSLSWETW